MPFEFSFRELSLKTRLIFSYLVILGIGGLATSMVGSWIVSTTIMRQVLRSAENGVATAWTVYQHQMQSLEQTMKFAASGATIGHYLSRGDRAGLLAYLEQVRQDARCDFLTLTDPRGAVILRVSHPGQTGDQASYNGVLKAALEGKSAAATEILSPAQLARENPSLAEQARLRLTDTPHARPFDRPWEESGLVMLAAAPVRGLSGEPLGALYGGALLSRDFSVVDHVRDLVLRDGSAANRTLGHVSIFQNDVRISTSLHVEGGQRAIGTRATPPVVDSVLRKGQNWSGSGFVVNDWCLSRYDPIRSYDGRVIGMLSVGILESTYTSTRNQVILSFFGVATIGFILIIGITYYMIRNITRPIGEMVAATQNIIAGRLDHEVASTAHGELALLAESFNTMLKSLQQMKADLEEWGRTLEEKVKQRTEELGAMQARVAQSERLASLGMLSAGVAHEINNPLGSILALTALTLEDVPPGDPNRESLEEVVRQSERCRNIVRGLLDFSRQSKVNTEPVDLNQILKNTFALISRQALFFNVNVRQDLDPELPQVMADKSQFQQVFMNIIMNAVQAMDEKGTITIVTRRAPGGFVEVQISDTGRGIPPEQIDRIFDPFFTTKESGHGTGLGLSIAYGIVTTHRGTITVSSKVGEGSTFTIRMPVEAVAPGELEG